MKVCHKTCKFFFFPIINKYLCMAKLSLLSRCPLYIAFNIFGGIQFRVVVSGWGEGMSVCVCVCVLSLKIGM